MAKNNAVKNAVFWNSRQNLGEAPRGSFVRLVSFNSYFGLAVVLGREEGGDVSLSLESVYLEED